MFNKKALFILPQTDLDFRIWLIIRAKDVKCNKSPSNHIIFIIIILNYMS